MAVNKVIYGNQTLIDITDTTTSADEVVEGNVFYSASGTRSVGANGLYWTNEGAPETIIRKSDGAVLTKLNSGDSVLNNKATTNMWDFANNPQKFLRKMGVNGGGNDVDLVINLNGLKNPSEFMEALRKDKKFERFLQEVTIGRVAGHGALSKNAMAFQLSLVG